jgi:hypothetical protein
VLIEVVTELLQRNLPRLKRGQRSERIIEDQLAAAIDKIGRAFRIRGIIQFPDVVGDVSRRVKSQQHHVRVILPHFLLERQKFLPGGISCYAEVQNFDAPSRKTRIPIQFFLKDGGIHFIEGHLQRFRPGVAEDSDANRIRWLFVAAFFVVKPIAIDAHQLPRFRGNETVCARMQYPAALAIGAIKLRVEMHSSHTKRDLAENWNR